MQSFFQTSERNLLSYFNSLVEPTILQAKLSQIKPKEHDMVKVSTEKSDVKKDDNGQTFVKNRGGFHPAAQDLSEKASKDYYENLKKKTDKEAFEGEKVMGAYTTDEEGNELGAKERKHSKAHDIEKESNSDGQREQKKATASMREHLDNDQDVIEGEIVEDRSKKKKGGKLGDKHATKGVYELDSKFRAAYENDGNKDISEREKREDAAYNEHELRKNASNE